MIALGTPTQLKRDRMQDVLLNLSCTSPQDILDEILSLPEVRDAALFGAGLHITVHDETEGMRAIQKILDNTNRTNVHLERITPSMEDVFVSLIEETDRNREQAS
jgi:ABC-2 type transport system ATP-binding protein